MTGPDRAGRWAWKFLAACRKAAGPGMGQNSTSEAGLTVEAIPA
jgi:hypothetical protein